MQDYFHIDPQNGTLLLEKHTHIGHFFPAITSQFVSFIDQVGNEGQNHFKFLLIMINIYIYNYILTDPLDIHSIIVKIEDINGFRTRTETDIKRNSWCFFYKSTNIFCIRSPGFLFL